MSLNEEYLVSNIDGTPNYSVIQFKKKKSKIALVIPVLNESYRIINQLEKIKELNPEVDVIIADGGSTDISRSYFLNDNQIFSVLLTKMSAGGLSTQLRMAFHYCIEKSYEAVITMDGNDKDGVEGILTINKALQEGFDFVQGSRFIPGGIATNTPFLRSFAIRFLHAPLTSIASGKHFTDTTNGFRGFSEELLESEEVSVFRDLFITYELIFYLPIRATRLGMKTCEVPVRREYPKGAKTPTKIIGVLAYLRLLKILLLASIGKFNPNAM